MYIDKELAFSEAQDLTGTANSTNVLDLGPSDSGKSDDLYLYVKTGTVFNTLTSLAISLGVDDNESFTSEKTVFSQTFLLAALTANTDLIKIKLPVGMERYARMTYTVAGSNPSTGTISAYLVQQVQTNP